MAAEHEDAIKALTKLREALEQMHISDPQFDTLLQYHCRRIENIEADVLEHEKRNP